MRARRAAALGALHGPAELLPVSSSAHVALVAGELGAAERLTLEVALHTGSGLALAWLLRADAAQALRALDARRLALHVLALGLPSLGGGLLAARIEERLGHRAALAGGLAAGACALAGAEALPAGRRTRAQAGALDGLALGLAQAAALWPGVSRRGATLAAARLRGFGRAESDALSWEVGLPVLGAATALRAARLAADPPDRAQRRVLAAGAAAAAASALACAPLLHTAARRPWWPFAAYRLGLAAYILAAGGARGGVPSRRPVRQDGPR